MARTAARPRNDPALYDDLSWAWWAPRGPFAMLAWIARARAELVPSAERSGAVLADLACGGGLLAPHLANKGYRHVGIDLSSSALRRAVEHGVSALRADVLALPLPDASADVVCAGEILEHVDDLEGVAAEACRVLRPGGLVVLDTIAATALARLLVVTIAERVPGAAPAGIHDPALFVDRRRLRAAFDTHGVRLELSGLRPSAVGLARFLIRNQDEAAMRRCRSTAVLFQGVGRKERAGTA